MSDFNLYAELDGEDFNIFTDYAIQVYQDKETEIWHVETILPPIKVSLPNRRQAIASFAEALDAFECGMTDDVDVGDED